MLSKFTLKILDANLTKEYNEKRGKEILPMCAGISALQIVSNIIVAIISITSNWNEYILELWLGRIIGIVVNIILVIILYKYPAKVVPYIAGMMELNQLCLLLWNTGHEKDNMPKNAMPASIAGLSNTMMYGLLINANWILTSVSILIVTASTLTYYTIMFKYVDYVTISILGNTIFFLAVAFYQIEKRDKMEFLAYKQITQMNDELKSILMNLPEGILLINDESSKVSLNNSEFMRIFQMSSAADPDAISDMVKQQTVSLYSDGGQDVSQTFRTENDGTSRADTLDKINILSAAV